MHLRAILLAILFAPGPVAAGQPISESMVHCGALYAVAGSWMETPDKAERLYSVSEAWADAARERATAEGRADPEAYVAGLWGGKCDAVASKGKLYVFTEDFRDWMGYCRALGRRMNVDVSP